MHDDRCVQPRQIYASTLARRDRRWTRRRGRGALAAAVVLAATLAMVLTVVGVLAPGLT